MLNNYEVFFEIYGKKMKTTVSALSRSDAEEIVRNRLIIREIRVVRDGFYDNPFNDLFNDFFGGKK